EETFVLARDPERISIKEILDCVRNSGVRKQTVRTNEEVFIEAVLREVDDSVAQALEGKSLQSLIVEHTGPPLDHGLAASWPDYSLASDDQGVSPPIEGNESLP